MVNSRILRTRDLKSVSMTSVLLVCKTLKTHANICRALSHIIFIWGAQDKSSDTVIPNSLYRMKGTSI